MKKFIILSLFLLYSCSSLPLPDEPNLKELSLKIEVLDEKRRAVLKEELEALLLNYNDFKAYILKLREFRKVYEEDKLK